MVDIGAGNRRCNRTGVISRLDTEVLEKVAPLASSILRKVGIRTFKKIKKKNKKKILGCNICCRAWKPLSGSILLDLLYISLSHLFLFLSGVVSPVSLLEWCCLTCFSS